MSWRARACAQDYDLCLLSVADREINEYVFSIPAIVYIFAYTATLHVYRIV